MALGRLELGACRIVVTGDRLGVQPRRLVAEPIGLGRRALERLLALGQQEVGLLLRDPKHATSSEAGILRSLEPALALGAPTLRPPSERLARAGRLRRDRRGAGLQRRPP